MDNNIEKKTGKIMLLEGLGKENTPFYFLLSAGTKEPYVHCDSQTFDDECRIFFQEESASAEAKKLTESGYPVTVGKLESKQMLSLFTSLYTLGINAIRVGDTPEDVMQVEEIVKRKPQDQIPKGTQWIENPQLHLTALYFAQELRKQGGADMNRIHELQEELAAHLKRGKLLFALEQDGKGTPIVKLKNGDCFQPVFTDAMAFSRFNREKKFKSVIVDAEKLPQVLDKNAKGVILNIGGVNLPFSVEKG